MAGSLSLPLGAVPSSSLHALEHANPSGPQSADGELQQELAALLEAHLGSDVEASAALDQRLDELRSRDAGALLEVLALGGVPAAWRPDESSLWVLPNASLQWIKAGLSRLRLADLRSLCERVQGAEEREVMRLKAMQLLGELGTVKDLRLMLGLAAPRGSRGGVVPISNRRKLEAALIRMCEQDSRVPGALGGLFRELHEGLQPSIIRVLGQHAGQDSLELLSDTLGVAAHLDAYVLNAISQCARSVAHPIDSRILSRVHACLEDPDPHVSMGAMVALGALEDFEAIPFLTDALEHEDSQVRRQALLALRELTGLGYGLEAKRWRDWYQRESDWWKHEALGLRQDLLTGDQRVARAALERIARGSLDRHRLAEFLLPGLARPEPHLVILSCAALERLASPRALSPLVALLHQRNEAVVEAAHGALMGITQMKLPMDPALWAKQLDSL